MDTRNLRIGAGAGLVAGVVLGGMTGSLNGLLLLIGELAGRHGEAILLAAKYPVLGLALHVSVSSLAGLAFGWLFGRRVTTLVRGAVSGAAFGAFWWTLGPMTFLPYLFNAHPLSHWSLTGALELAPSLALHVAYGAILGVGFAWWKLKALAHAGELSTT